MSIGNVELPPSPELTLEQYMNFLCKEPRDPGSAHNDDVSMRIKDQCDMFGYPAEVLLTPYTRWKQISEPSLKLVLPDGTTKNIPCIPVVLSGSTNEIVTGTLTKASSITTIGFFNWRRKEIFEGKGPTRRTLGYIMSGRHYVQPTTLVEGIAHLPHLMIEPPDWNQITNLMNRKGSALSATMGSNTEFVRDQTAPSILARSSSSHSPVLIGTHFDTYPWGVGAHDNASGTAVMLGLLKNLLNHQLDVAFWNLEERGAAGSRNYVQRAQESGILPCCYINVDSVGWGDAIHLLVSPSMYPQVANLVEKFQYDCRYDILVTPRVNIEPYDATPFVEHKVPVVNIATVAKNKTFPFYHRTEDKLDTINYPLMHEVSKFIMRMALNLDTLTS